jgi:hypothetical protein
LKERLVGGGAGGGDGGGGGGGGGVVGGTGSGAFDGGSTSLSRPQGGTDDSDVEIFGYTVVIDGHTSATGIGYGGGAAMPTGGGGALGGGQIHVPPGQEPYYNELTGAPANAAAQRDVAREWASGVGSDGGKARVVRLPFRELDAATNRFEESAVIGNGASCAVFRCHLFGLPVAVKR